MSPSNSTGLASTSQDRLDHLETQLSAMLEHAIWLQRNPPWVASASAGQCNQCQRCACKGKEELEQALGDLAQMRANFIQQKSDTEELKADMKRLRLELDRVKYLRLEALAQLKTILHEFGTVVQQVAKEAMLLRNNVAHAIRVAFVRGRGGTLGVAQDDAERFQKMPIRAELDVREEEIELLTLDLALLAHDANLENFRREQSIKATCEHKLKELSDQRESKKDCVLANECMRSSNFSTHSAFEGEGSGCKFKATALSIDQHGSSSQEQSRQQAISFPEQGTEGDSDVNAVVGCENFDLLAAADSHDLDSLENGTQTLASEIQQCARRATIQLENALLLFAESEDGLGDLF